MIVAPVPGVVFASTNVIVGDVVYPEPGFVKYTDVTTLLVTTAAASAPEPPPPVIVTIAFAFVEYAVPPLEIVISELLNGKLLIIFSTAIMP